MSGGSHVTRDHLPGLADRSRSSAERPDRGGTRWCIQGYGGGGVTLSYGPRLPRLSRFRTKHPEVIIGDGGFGTVQARIPEPDGESVITRYTLRELLDRLDEMTAAPNDQPGCDPG